MAELLSSDLKRVPTESLGQTSVVERHGAVLGDIANMIVQEEGVNGGRKPTGLTVRKVPLVEEGITGMKWFLLLPV